ncbi:riboflavin synthase alpha chain [Cryptosporangium arvum DSM 44712]|uniref:Riboflavin synthase n=2 Tax=Cryptosporangium TaxID=65502 RepID=A0A010YMA7_9ACTN|nr:riboflavin synthase [Cryptosporangium arvum]EXG81350.1 riboflavin synthase alpha chain [Cryptosporangium arvum DSM 44712]
MSALRSLLEARRRTAHMFTGIVEELGTLAAVEELDRAARLRLKGPRVAVDATYGDSIAVNGVCLTVVENTGDEFTADVMAETLTRSALGGLVPGDPVNLERAATLSTRLGGHLVQGHVDGVGTVLERRPDTHWEVVRIGLPPELGRYVVEKGSIAVDGVSLTVTAVADDWFEVSLIPTTLSATTLGGREPGSRVNLEVDVVAKYVEKLLPGPKEQS